MSLGSTPMLRKHGRRLPLSQKMRWLLRKLHLRSEGLPPPRAAYSLRSASTTSPPSSHLPAGPHPKRWTHRRVRTSPRLPLSTSAGRGSPATTHRSEPPPTCFGSGDFPRFPAASLGTATRANHNNGRPAET